MVGTSTECKTGRGAAGDGGGVWQHMHRKQSLTMFHFAARDLKSTRSSLAKTLCSACGG